jgi:XTP/dITP diphosphohydrolase
VPPKPHSRQPSPQPSPQPQPQPQPTPPLLLATANPHKVAELRAIFASAGIPVECLADIPSGRDIPEPVEHAHTFLDNAAIKAREYARAAARVCLSDDSGLAVDALRGDPGVNSSHYAAPPADPASPSAPAAFAALPRARRDALNNAKLLANLAHVPFDQRSARFVCVMVLAAPDGRILHSTRGEFHGRIGLPPRIPAGANGFGYDPLFLVAPDFARTGAELDPADKNRRSHRAIAAHAMAAWLAANPDALTN